MKAINNTISWKVLGKALPIFPIVGIVIMAAMLGLPTIIRSDVSNTFNAHGNDSKIPPSTNIAVSSPTNKKDTICVVVPAPTGMNSHKPIGGDLTSEPATAILDEEGMPPLDPGMVNVTASGGSIRLAVERNLKKVVCLKIDPIKMPIGYVSGDVSIFNFNRLQGRWKQLHTDSLDISNNLVYATASEDGDYIAAIIRAPEGPESQGYMPTTMKDIQVGDPAAMVQVITPPKVNHFGSASISYKIETPPGRLGIQPDLSVLYDSDAGSGSLGEGWSISGISSITVDTRWGAPAFDSGVESETYLLDGQMLACMHGDTVITPHRFLHTPRSTVTNDGVTRFYLRKENSFHRIQRIGNSPTNYYWVVTDKKGTRYFYGGEDPATLQATFKNPKNNNIAEWKLFKVEDVFGNIVDFRYRTTSALVPLSTDERITNIIPETITYTRFSNSQDKNDRRPPNFSVVFGFVPKKNSKQFSISGRYGFLTGNIDSLVYISIIDLKDKQPIRRYRFFYREDAMFGKVLLDSVAQYGLKNKFFNGHKFDYYDTPGEGWFAAPKTWAIPEDGLIAPSFNLVSNKTTAIGATKSSGKNYGSYFGLGIIGNTASKNFTIGAQFGGSSSNSSGINTLLDIDGDAVPDKIFADKNGIYYHRGNGSGFDAAKVPLSGLPVSNFSEEYSRTSNYGFQGNFAGFFVGNDNKKTESTISTYFQDVNGDGLVDLVSNNRVYFNCGKSPQGTHMFSLNSSQTPVTMNVGTAVASFEAKAELADRSAELAKENPLQEVVKVWEAPFDGDVTITAPVTFVSVQPAERDNDYKKVDGLRVSIQKGGTKILGTDSIPHLDVDKTYLTGSYHERVSKGECIYFRVQSGVNGLTANGAFDRIKWEPIISYASLDPTKVQNDIYNRNIYYYSAKEDYLLSGSRELTIDTLVSKFDLNGQVEKLPTLDTVWLIIYQLKVHEKFYPDKSVHPFQTYVRDRELHRAFLEPNQKGRIAVSRNSIAMTNTDTSNSFLEFAIISKSTIDLHKVTWDPKIHYDKQFIKRCLDNAGNVVDCAGAGSLVKEPRDIYPVPRYTFADSLYAIGEVWQVPDTSKYTIIPRVIFKKPVSFEFPDQNTADLVFTLRDTAGLIDYQKYSVPSGTKEISFPEISLPLDSARKVFGAFETQDPGLNGVLQPTYELKRSRWNASVFNAAEQNVAGQTDTIRHTGTYRIYLSFLVQDNTRKGSFDVDIVNQQGAIIKKVTISYDSNRVVLPADPVMANFVAGQVISVRFQVNDTAVIARIQEASYQNNQSLTSFAYLKRVEPKFGPMYRGWGQFLYNGMEGRAEKAIVEKDLAFKTDVADSKRAQIEAVGADLKAGKTTTNVEIPGIDEFSPLKAAFAMMMPYADGTIRRWQGSDAAVYLDRGTMSASRIGLKDVKLIDPFAAVVSTGGDNSAAFGIKKMSFTATKSLTIGYSGLSYSDSKSNPFSELVADFVDLNGDRYPDIITKTQVQFTNPAGGFRKLPWTASEYHKSRNKSIGIVAGGGFYHSISAQTAFPGVNRVTKQTGLTTAESNRTILNASISVGIPTQGNVGEENTVDSWLDVNGDGLADRIYENGKVRLNLGLQGNNLNLSAPIDYETGPIHSAKNMSIPPGLSLGISLSNRSFTAGTGMSISNSAIEFVLQDFNNDGLPDRVYFGETGPIDVEINTGFGFLPRKNGLLDVSVPTSELNSDEVATLPIKYLPRIPDIKVDGRTIPNPINTWINLDRRKVNGSIAQSITGSATLGFNIWIPFTPFIRFVFNPEAGFNTSMGKTYRQFIDVNGDGYTDYIYSSKESALVVRLSNLGKVNKLKKVINPLGGSFIVDYQNSGATVAHPSGKWVMASVTIDDGDASDRETPVKGYDAKQDYQFLAGKYDRNERQFLGFGKVEIRDKDFNDTLYRTHHQEYDTANYFVAGNLLKEYVTDKNGNMFTETVNDYYLYTLQPNGDDYSKRAVATPDDIRASRYQGICFTAARTVKKFNYEKSKAPIILNQILYAYNATGVVNSLKYREGKPVSDTAFDYESKVELQAMDLRNYIIDLPQKMKVAKGAKIFRESQSNYNPMGKPETVIKKLQKDSLETTIIKYTPFGTIDTIVKSNGIVMDYDYDAITNTYVEKVMPTPGFTSEAKYDIKFGIQTESKDKNDNYIRYLLDEFGRIDTVVGPKECNDRNVVKCKAKYTIRVVYSTKDRPYTIVNHFDGAKRSGMETISFADGFGRITTIKKTATVTQGDGSQHPAKWVVSGRNIYDAMGRAVRTHYPGIDIERDGTKNYPVVDNSTPPIILTFDELDRPTSKKMPDNAIVFSKQYGVAHGLSVVVTQSPNEALNGGNQVRWQFTNGSGLKAKDSAAVDGKNDISTTYVYDEFHQLSKVIDENDKITSFRYDLGGNRTLADHPDGGRTEFLYDKASRLVGKITANGQVSKDTIKYLYDSFNHLVLVDYPRHKENNVRYYYGSADACRDCRDRLVFQEDASGAQSFIYDELGNVKKTKRTIIVPFSQQLYTFVTSFEFDTWNRIKMIHYPDGEKVTYSYNIAGLLESISGVKRQNGKDLAPTRYVSNIGYDKFERQIQLTFANGVTSRFKYDPQRRRLNESITSGMKVDPTASSSLFTTFTSTFKYDNQDNIVSNDNSQSTGHQMQHTYRYDVLNRLDSANGKWKKGNEKADYELGLDYDELFNVKRKHLILNNINGPDKRKIDYSDWMDYSDKGYQLTSLSETIVKNDIEKDKEVNIELYSYDANGNNTLKARGDRAQKHITERRIVWDDENRVSAVSMGGYVSNYVYDGAGERTIKLSTKGSGMMVNGKLAGRDQQTSATFSLYANPYFSMRNGAGLYTKHIYMEHVRIASQLESEAGFLNHEDQINPTTPKTATCPKGADEQIETLGYVNRRALVNQRLNADFDSLDLPYLPIAEDAFKELPVVDAPIIQHPFERDRKQERIPKKNTAETFNYYYHNNHLGSTSFVTDDNKNVVHYVEYLPYGEVFWEQSTNYNSQFLFNGKEQDQESGLYYFGARYYDPQSYQWLGVDPMWENYQGKSSYNYCLNNPVLYVDIKGKWASKWGAYVHQKANEVAVWNNASFASSADVENARIKAESLNAGTVWADLPQHQTPGFSHMHAMSNRDIGQSVDDAKSMTDKYVREMYDIANYYRDAGDMSGAYFYLGAGLHAIQDATSPEHAGFQPWGSNESWSSLISHAAGESLYPGAGSLLQRATNEFINNFDKGKSLPKHNIFDRPAKAEEMP